MKTTTINVIALFILLSNSLNAQWIELDSGYESPWIFYGNPSTELEVSVGAPTPEVSGEEMVCDWSDEFYEVDENEGSTLVG